LASGLVPLSGPRRPVALGVFFWVGAGNNRVMRGLTQGEQSSASWPVLQFFCRQGGKLADPVLASFTIEDIRSDGVAPATLVGPTILGAGDKLGTGRYALATGATAVWSLGTHRVVVTYKLAAAGPDIKQVIEFEILDEVDWAHGGGEYIGYLSTRQAYRDDHAAAGDTTAMLHREICQASKQIEFWTARCFHPEYRSVYVGGNGTEWLLPNEPIICIEQIAWTHRDSDDAEVEEVVQDSSYECKAMTHLDGERGRDGRIFVGIELMDSWRSSNVRASASTVWSDPSRAYKITGVFGYTDGIWMPGEHLTGMGETPRDLARVVGAMVYRALEDANLQAPFGGGIGGVSMIKTRDQTIKWGASADGVAGFGGVFTGDSELDRIIHRYVAPTRITVAGRARDWSGGTF